MWEFTEEEIRDLLDDETRESDRIGISLDETYLSISIRYDDEPPFISSTLDKLFDGDYSMKADIDPDEGFSSYVVELKDDSTDS